LIQQLQAYGFPDEGEIRRALRLARQQQSSETPITLETLICDIIAAREEAALAHDMDEARRQSELEHQQEQERLHQQRTEETLQRLLNASLHELLHPSPHSSHIFFPRSWLLRHAPLQSLLEDITQHHMEIKKELIPLLQLEKNAFRWYSNGIAKSFYTHHLTKILLADLDLSLLPSQLQEICQEIQEGHALLSKQNSSGIPLIYIKAQEEFPTNDKDQDEKSNHNDGDNNSNEDDDDEVQILDEEEIQKLKEKILSPEPAAPIEVDQDVDGND
jgi:hypothetical protein